ncbi:MAG: GxxExxY protein [Sandaracinaceae bacterium]|nr:GxxExxY protein [Sandaracinaceae bacterium]
MERKLAHEGLTGEILAACIEVHRHLGPGLLESAYERCLAHELGLRGIRFLRQREVPVRYKEVVLGCGYRVDFDVEGLALLEIKAVERLLPVHEAQVLTYLRLLGRPVGLLVNFHVPAIRQSAIRRLQWRHR